MEQFKLTSEYIPLVQLLKALNWVESGGMAKMVVEEGLVAVNGQKETRKRKKLTHGDIVTMDELQVQII
ncbi:MAG: RNA-binding S4 domain-containing protein [Bacteroidales bacterium]